MRIFSQTYLSFNMKTKKKVADDFISFMFNFNAYVLDFKKEEKKRVQKEFRKIIFEKVE